MGRTQYAGARRVGPVLMGLLACQMPVFGEAVVELSAFPVYAGLEGRWSGTVAGQLTERMDREVRVDLHSRGGARYQTDITVRGGIFEGTGLMVGGLALFDPQTGHYFAEVPLDPGFFSGARLLTGVKQAISGFNSTTGSIDWAWGPIESGGEAILRLGSDRLVGGTLRAGGLEEGGLGWQVAVSREAGDGSVSNGDFEMERMSGRLDLPLGTGQLRLFGGQVSKFYGWPGMYTGIRSLNETEDYTVGLLGWQYEWRQGRQAHRVGGYWRGLEDDYEFRREVPNSLFEHQTEVWSVQGDGQVEWRDLGIQYRWVLLRDRINRSTSLVNGAFADRRYVEGAVLVEGRHLFPWGELRPYAGAALQSSNEDSTVGSPQAGMRAAGTLDKGVWELYGEFSQTSRVPGYTVLKSAPTGLFGGNPDLGRETARTLEVGLNIEQGPVRMQAVVFRRDDEDLVDWVYRAESPSARQAAGVDLIVQGLESRITWEAGSLQVEAAYAYLHKEANYGERLVDASYYALNYARHRLLLAVGKRVGDDLGLRLEGEWRQHPANLLRLGGDEALTLHAEVVWERLLNDRVGLVLRLENLTRETFEPFPGTPGPGREGWISLSADW